MPDHGKSLTVLMAEDEQDLGEAIELVLTDRGHHVVHARDGQQALDLLEHVKADVLLLDLSMPRLDGFGVLRALRERPNKPAVVVMSAFHQFLPETLALGAAATLRKPFSPEDLDAAFVSARRGGPTRPENGSRTAPGPLPGADDLLGTQRRDDELERLDRLYCLRVMSADRDEMLDELTSTTAKLLRTPIALVSIITEDRQWWKSMFGVPPKYAAARGSHKDLSFCTHAVAARAPLIVQDAHEHPAFRDNPLVLEGFLTAYAGVPVQIPAVGAIGTLCVLDNRARVFSALDLELLALLASRVAAEVEWRERARNDPRPLGVFKYLSMVDERYGIYNPTAFSSFTGVIARLSLTEESQFALVGLKLHQDQIGRGVEALRRVAAPGDIIGWVDGVSLGALLPRTTADRANAFEQQVQAELRNCDKGIGRTAAASAVIIETGALVPHAILHRLRSRLHPGASGLLTDDRGPVP